MGLDDDEMSIGMTNVFLQYSRTRGKGPDIKPVIKELHFG
jgi:hypothetical protein